MAIKKLQGLDAIRRWVVKTFLKEKEQTGVMVNLPKKDFVDLNTSITAERLMRNGIDPNSIKSVDQVENIINQLNKPKVVSQGDPEFEGIMSKMTGKNVIEADFGKPFKEEIINMREPTRFFKGVEIKDPKFDENLPFDNDAEKLAEIKMSNEAYEQELEKKIKERLLKSNKEGIARIKEKSVFDLEDYDTTNMSDIKKEIIKLESQLGRLNPEAPNFREKAGPLVDKITELQKKLRDDKADGGRIGFKKGMDRRTFMKMVGGLTALPILGKFFKGAEVAAPVAEKAAEVASGAPPYFFNLVDRIRALGTKFAGPKERSESFRYKDYEMDIDYDTGKIDIKKTKEAMIPGGDEAGISEEVYMTYKPGMADETTKGGKVVDEYEEFTARPDIDGKMKDVEEGVPDEVVREGSIGKEQLEEEIVEQIARDKKASGGLAYMLGE